MEQLINKRFGKLVIVEDVPRPIGKNYGRTWLRCKCDCGGETIVPWEKIRYDKVEACGCRKRRRGADSPFWKGCGQLSHDLFSGFQRNAAARDIEFSVTISELWELFKIQGGKCALSGVELSLDYQGDRLSRKKKETSTLTASIDRKDSTKGYSVGNVQWVHKRINIMKNDLSDTEFVEWCKVVSSNNS